MKQKDVLYRQKLFIVFNRAMKKAKQSPDYLKIKQRLCKALGILQHHDYYVAEKAQYQPTYYTCNCDDWKYHLSAKRQYKGPCKHMMAEILLERVEQIKFIQLDFFSVCGG